MTIEQLRAATGAAPFRPFTVRVADGRSFLVPHPDFISQSPAGRTIIIYQSNESFSILDLLLVSELEFQSPSTPRDGAAA